MVAETSKKYGYRKPSIYATTLRTIAPDRCRSHEQKEDRQKREFAHVGVKVELTF